MAITVHKNTKEKELIDKVEPVLINLGFSCRDIEVVSGRSAIVRIIIDVSKESTSENKNESGISVDDCATVHRVLNPMFDVWDPLPGAYTLEVSSPGEKPALRELSHFKEAIGEKIKFQTLEAVELPEPSKPRKNWEGELLEVKDDGLFSVKDHAGQEHTLKIEEVKNVTWLREWTA